VSRTLSLHRQLSAVLCGGFCGTITRYWLSQLIQAHLGKGWPYDIFLINITGALLLAFITTLADATFLIGPTRRLFISVGFLGAYTTFSSLALGDVQLAMAGHWLSALSYLFISLAIGILAILCGKVLGQWVINRMQACSVAKPSLQEPN
jgi:fluoride exporter